MTFAAYLRARATCPCAGCQAYRTAPELCARCWGQTGPGAAPGARCRCAL